MYGKMAATITNKLIHLNVIESVKYDVYAYGFEILISYLCYFLIFLAISLVTSSLLESICFFFGFFFIRKFAGGYHAPTYKMCHLLFSINQLLFLAMYRFYPASLYSYAFIAVVAYSVGAVFICAPVDHENKPFSAKEFARFRKRSRIYAILLAIVFGAVVLVHQLHPFLFCYLIGTFSASISLTVAKLLKIRHSA